MLKRIPSILIVFSLIFYIQCKPTPTTEDSRLAFEKSKLELIASIKQDHPYLRFKSGNNNLPNKTRIGFIDKMKDYKQYLSDDKREYTDLEKMILQHDISSNIQSNGLCNVILDQSINRERKKEFILKNINKITEQYDTIQIRSGVLVNEHCLQVQIQYILENKALFRSNDLGSIDSFIISSKTLIAKINSHNYNLRDKVPSQIKHPETYAPLDSTMYHFAIKSLGLDSLDALYFSI